MEGGSTAGARAGGLGVRHRTSAPRRRRRGTYPRVVAPQPPCAPAPSPPPTPMERLRQHLNSIDDLAAALEQDMALLRIQRENADFHLAGESLDCPCAYAGFPNPVVCLRAARTQELEAEQNRTRAAVVRALRRGAVMALAMAESMVQADLGGVEGFPEGQHLRTTQISSTATRLRRTRWSTRSTSTPLSTREMLSL